MIKRFLPGITACLAIFAGMDVAVAQVTPIYCPQSIKCTTATAICNDTNGPLKCSSVKTGPTATLCDNNWGIVVSGNSIPDSTSAFIDVIINGGTAKCEYDNSLSIYPPSSSPLKASGTTWGPNGDEGQICGPSSSNCPMSP